MEARWCIDVLSNVANSITVIVSMLYRYGHIDECTLKGKIICSIIETANVYIITEETYRNSI